MAARYLVIVYPWRLFETQIHGFINRRSEESMRSLPTWLTAGPRYRQERVES